jgi:hypothetical protein
MEGLEGISIDTPRGVWHAGRGDGRAGDWGERSVDSPKNLTFLAMLSLEARDIARFERRMRLLEIALASLFICAWFVLWIMDAALLWQAWRVGFDVPWPGWLFWLILLMTLCATVLPAMALDEDSSGFDLQRVGAEQARAVRWAVAAGDEQVAPFADPQPLSASELPSGSVALDSLRRAHAQQGTVMFSLGIGIVLILGGFGVIMLLVFLVAATDVFAALLPLLVMSALLGPLIGFGVFLVRTGEGILQPLRVVADEDGVEWDPTRHKARVRVPWREARSFFALTRPTGDAAGECDLVYVLDTDAGALVWTAPQPTFDASKAESDTLVRLIVTRTGLPLRAVSCDALPLKTQDDAPEPSTVRGAFAQIVGLWDDSSGERRALPRLLLFLILFSLTLVLCAAGAWVQFAVPLFAPR